MPVDDILFSIVIPHHNQYDQLNKCLRAIARLDFDPACFELIIVQVHGEEKIEHAAIQNCRIVEYPSPSHPYVARNLGISVAKGRYIALLDAACVPMPPYLAAAYDKFLAGHKIIAGRFTLQYASDDLRDLVHGILYLNNEKNTLKRYGNPAGNLLVDKSVFTDLGLFSTELSTGADIRWTRLALSSGYEIAYCSSCEVRYPSISYEVLLEKQRKYAQGIVRELRSYSCSARLSEIVRGFLPMRWANFMSALKYRRLHNLSITQALILYIWVWKSKINLAVQILKKNII